MYDLLFTPMNIGRLEIKNRFVMPPMSSHYTDGRHHLSEQACNYYAERAKGGFGLLITEYLCVSEEGLSGVNQAGIYEDAFIPSLAAVVERVHQNGGKILAQLQHSGRLQGEGVTSLPPVGASKLPEKERGRAIHELTTEEVQGIIQKFVEAAIRAQKAGFDGVELHGAHGYLLAQFLSKGVNRRVDAYGGNTSGRAKIVCETIEAVKAACGSDYPVVVRTSGKEAYAGGNTVEDARAQALLFEMAGADAVHISYGVAIQSNYADAGFNIENVKAVKDVLGIPVIGVGRINDPSIALSAVASGSMDFVALGRQSICDPHFPEKVATGRTEEIFTCTGCMQRCLYSDSYENGFGTSCMINPFSGKEGLWTIDEAPVKKRIAVVGAGPAGLEAAWILAKRGHQVTVVEKNATAGGQYRLASVPPMKQGLSRTIFTYLTLCKKYQAEILYETTADEVFLAQEAFDEVIVATGSLPIVPKIEGIDHSNVYLANDILGFEKYLADQKVLVLGAGLVGVETAEVLAQYGNQVTVVDMVDRAAPLAPKRPREDLLAHLEELKVTFVLNSKVQKINEDGIDYETGGVISRLDGFDSIVLAFGSRSNNELYLKLKETGTSVHVIGDAALAGDAKKAIYEAAKLALTL